MVKLSLYIHVHEISSIKHFSKKSINMTTIKDEKVSKPDMEKNLTQIHKNLNVFPSAIKNAKIVCDKKNMIYLYLV